MRTDRIGALALAAALVAGGAGAQEFRGAELSAEVLGFTDDFGSGQTTYRAGAEMGVWGGIGIAADLGWHGFRGLGSDSRNVTIHGLYDFDGLGTAGLFWSRDSLDGGDATTWGAEMAASFGGAAIEGHLGRLDDSVVTGTLAGVDATYALGGLGVTGRIGLLRGDAGDATQVAAGAEYRLGLGPTLYGELGRQSEAGEDATFVTLGARVAIGSRGGTTFGPRGLFEVLTGR